MTDYPTYSVEGVLESVDLRGSLVISGRKFFFMVPDLFKADGVARNRRALAGIKRLVGKRVIADVVRTPGGSLYDNHIIGRSRIRVSKLPKRFSQHRNPHPDAFYAWKKGDLVLYGSVRGVVEAVVDGSSHNYGVRLENGNFKWVRPTDLKRLPAGEGRGLKNPAEIKANPKKPKRNPQRSFNPVDYYWTWTKDWYTWDRERAIKAARKDRDEAAKKLAAQGYRVKKWSNAGQLITRGGIGSGHPQIEEVVTVYMLDTR